MKNKLKSNLIYQTFYQILSIILPLISSPVVSRRLGANGLGVYSYTLSVANYFIVFALLGIGTYGMREISQSREEDISNNFWSIYFVQLMSSILSLCIYLCVSLVFYSNYIEIMLINSLCIISQTFNISWFYFGKNEYKYIVVKNTILKILSFVSIIIFVNGEYGLIIYILIMAISAFLENFVLWFGISKFIKIIPFRKLNVKRHLKPIFILFVPVLATSVYQIMDKTMLGILSTEENSGYYYNADKLLNTPLQIITGCSNVFLTQISELVKNGNNNEIQNAQKKAFTFAIFTVSPLALGIAGISKEFVPIFFGNDFEPCIVLTYIFAVIIIVKAISSYLRAVFLIPYKKDNIYIKSVIGGAITNFIANIILIYSLSLGALGATIGTLLAEICVLLIQIIYTIREKEKIMSLLIVKNSIYIFFGFIMFFMVKMIEHISFSVYISLAFKVIIGTCIYFVLCLIYWKFFAKEILLLISSFFNKFKKYKN